MAPIRPDLRRFYGHTWKHETRMRALARAKRRCERCRKPDRAVIETVSGKLDGEPVMVWRRRGTVYDPWHCRDGSITTDRYVRSLGFESRIIRVVISVTHRNHRPGDDEDDNLVALCQWCHLNYDRLQHAATRSERKDRARPLLRMAG
jgi:hypothetical protein